ncbi:hypothetical protein JCM10213_004268 [Rhodosporidiobolus nylandii]
MSDADSPIASTSASEAQPTFKRKKRPQARTLSLRAGAGGGSGNGSGAGSEVEGAEGAPAEGEEEEGGASETLDSLLALRRLKRSTAGLDLERLNAGERKKRARAAAENEGAGDGQVVTAEGMIEGTNGGLRGGKDRLRDDGDAPETKARKIVKSDNFTGQTNTVDVDKHMLAYIDAELAKKRAPAEGSSSTGPSKPYDPRDDLYRVADKYKFEDIAATEKSKKDRDEDEGNVTLSASMLMGIPEVDLGIDIKLRNIEATEKAKRKLHEDQVAERRRRLEEPEEFAVDRFYRHRRPLESDDSALARAKAEAARAADPAAHDPDAELRRLNRPGRRETATDEMAMARFKKRQMSNFKK